MKKISVVLSTLIVALVIVGAGVGIFAWSGMYTIGADVPHWTITYDALDWFRDRAVQHYAASIKVPVDLESAARISEGAKHYSEMCVGCHLQPGKSSNELREGLYPKPPNFSTMKEEINPGDTFWVIKHGIKMSAMPAWGKSHSDDTIWAIVAFVCKLPTMSSAEYDAYTVHARSQGGDYDHEAHHGGDMHENSESMPTPPAGKTTYDSQ